VFDLIKNFIYAVFLVLLAYAFEMSPETAQLKDFLALLHSDQAHLRVFMLTGALTLLNNSFWIGSSISNTRCFVSSSPVHGFTSGSAIKKSDAQGTAAPK
jgi:hypothetical protein